MITTLLEKLGVRPLIAGHVIGCGCTCCTQVRDQRQLELIERRARGIAGNTLGDLIMGSFIVGAGDLLAEHREARRQRAARSFWLGVIAERLVVVRGRAEDTIAWATERGWSNSSRVEHGRQQRAMDAYLAELRRAQGTLVEPLRFWQGVLCERYIMLAEGRLSGADKRRMRLPWFTSEENIAHMMIDLMHSSGWIGPNGLGWMREQLHQRGEGKAYDLQRSRDILRAAHHMLLETTTS